MRFGYCLALNLPTTAFATVGKLSLYSTCTRSTVSVALSKSRNHLCIRSCATNFIKVKSSLVWLLGLVLVSVLCVP